LPDKLHDRSQPERRNNRQRRALGMPSRKLHSVEDCEDFVLGCLFLATGGGGSPERGMRMLKGALEDGIVPEWVDASSIPDDVLTASPYGMGSIAPLSEDTEEEIERLGLKPSLGDEAMAEAVKALQNYLGKPVRCLVAAEIGAGNTPGPLVTGARLGIPVVDGDYVGRAVPEELQATTYLYGKPSWPVASVDKWGDVAIIDRAVSSHMFERMGKMLAVAAYGGTTMAGTPLLAREMKEVLVHGTLTKSLAIGQAMRGARANGGDPIDAALTVTGGWRLFEGVVTGKEWEDRDGYMFGTTHVRGTDKYAGQTLDVWFKNENHISWLNGEPWICSPDLVTLVYKDSGEGITNSQIKEGDQVVAVGIKGLEAFRSEFGLNKAAGPRYFGFDIDYRPIEDLVADRK
jgi:DUF917 family protein